jgi:P2-related tail formation protein
MPTFALESRYDPSFYLHPIQNARTGYQPVFLPLLLVVPVKRDPNSGENVPSADVQGLTFFIEDAPNLRTPVAGFEHRGIFKPDLVLFRRDVSTQELLDAKVDITGLTFRRLTPDGEVITFEEAKDGDFFEYTLERGNSTTAVPFFKDADYFDLSPFEITTIDLPTNRYHFVWQASYHPRVLSPDGEFICISEAETRLTNFRIEIAHPGEIHQQMIERTPPLYFTGASLDRDAQIKFYRPFADILQDIFDEQSLIEGINWISRIPAQHIPYLAYLIGWDLPFFPDSDAKSTDNIRRAILRNAVKLQKLKTSRRAISELFEIFGFTAKLINTYFLIDGDGRLDVIAPDEKPPQKFREQKITSKTVCQLEPLAANFDPVACGLESFDTTTPEELAPFGGFEVPLVFRPSGTNITVTAYLVQQGSEAQTELDKAVCDVTKDPTTFTADSCLRITLLDGHPFIVPVTIENLLIGKSGLLGSAQVSIDATTGQTLDDTKGHRVIGGVQRGGLPTISKEGVIYDRDRNIINITFDGSIDFKDARLFVFASYERIELSFDPVDLKLRQSNRFDIEFVSKTGEDIDSRLLEYLISFLFKLKAFHSLLRKIRFPAVCSEVYNVTDFTVGGRFKQQPGTSAGDLQVPPPVIPVGAKGSDPGCISLLDRGYKPEDIGARQEILDALEREHEAWKARDATPDVPPVLQPVFAQLSRIQPFVPTRIECKYNPFGQDRVKTDVVTDFDHRPESRDSVCSLERPLPDYTYKGRVEDQLAADPDIDLSEIVRCKPCQLGMGNGLYVFIPNPGDVNIGGEERDLRSQDESAIGRLLGRYNTPKRESIHFIHGQLNHLNDFRRQAFLGILRPSLEIERDNLFFPGHRHPRMSDLLSDFTHPDWRARPWDDEFSLITCDRNRAEENGLNARLTTVGEEQFLVYDDVPLIYRGNGRTPDISSLGEQEERPFKVTHAIYMHTEPRPWDDFVATVVTEAECISRSDPFFVDGLFSSANAAGDFIDGYPADQRVFEISAGSGSDAGSDVFTVRFTCGSGILLESSDPEYDFHRGVRLDCGCLRFDGQCGTGGSSGSGSSQNNNIPLNSCSIGLFRDDDGSLDPDCDKLKIEQTILAQENFGTCSTRLDGEIPSLLCLLNQQGLIPDDPRQISATGSFRFRDDYGVIYAGAFEFNGSAIDITVATFSPRVPGEPDQGRVEKDTQGRLIVLRRGILSTIRQIIEITNSGYTIVAEGTESKVSFERVNDICGERQAKDDFCFHVDCQVLDDLEVIPIGSAVGSGSA